MNYQRKIHQRGFTLIELLIVVAIIAILAAIAVPNFLEAQTRAKVSRVKSDLRTFVIGLESYVVDYNKYPKSRPTVDPDSASANNWYCDAAMIGLIPLSTPVAYLTTVALKDPFAWRSKNFAQNPGGNQMPTATNKLNNFLSMEGQFRDSYNYIDYTHSNGMAAAGTITNYSWGDEYFCTAVRMKGHSKSLTISTGGPSPLSAATFKLMEKWTLRDTNVAYIRDVYNTLYDPTNGTVSQGSIVRISGESQGFPQTPN